MKPTRRTSGTKSNAAARVTRASYGDLVGGIGALMSAARRASTRAVNTIMTATYWDIGRRIVEFEQGGKMRADYGEELLPRLSVDLTARNGRGFSVDNLERFRLFYLRFPTPAISATPLRKSATARSSALTKTKAATASRQSSTSSFAWIETRYRSQLQI